MFLFADPVYVVRLGAVAALAWLWSSALLAADSQPTLKQIIEKSYGEAQPRGEQSGWYDFVRSTAAAHKNREQRSQFKGDQVEQVERRKLIVSWFQEFNVLEYFVNDDGKVHNFRAHQFAYQASKNSELNGDDQKKLDELLARLPASKANPPLERTVYVSFLVGKDWRTESYDANALPPDFEKVIALIGERPETQSRHKK